MSIVYLRDIFIIVVVYRKISIVEISEWLDENYIVNEQLWFQYVHHEVHSINAPHQSKASESDRQDDLAYKEHSIVVTKSRAFLEL